MKRNLDLIRIIDRLQALLEQRGEAVVRVDSLDVNSLDEAAARIEERLAEKLDRRLRTAVASSTTPTFGTIDLPPGRGSRNTTCLTRRRQAIHPSSA